MQFRLLMSSSSYSIHSPSEQVVVHDHGITAARPPPLEHLFNGRLVQPHKVRVLVDLLVVLFHELKIVRKVPYAATVLCQHFLQSGASPHS